VSSTQKLCERWVPARVYDAPQHAPSSARHLTERHGQELSLWGCTAPDETEVALADAPSRKLQARCVESTVVLGPEECP